MIENEIFEDTILVEVDKSPEILTVSALIDDGLPAFKRDVFIIDIERPDPFLPYQGEGYISGLTKVNDVIHPNAVMSLFAEDNFHVADVISDENGVFTFTNLNTTLKYFVVCKIDGWEYRVQSKVSPRV